MTFGLLLFITAIIVVIATSLLKSVSFSSRTKTLIAVGVSTVAGAVAALIEAGGFEGFLDSGLVGTVFIVFGLATAIYKIILPESVENKLATTLVHPKEPTVPERHAPGQFSDEA